MSFCTDSMQASSTLKTRNTEQRFPVHPNGYRFTHNVALWNLTPNATVAAVVAVITHHEVVARSNHYREISDWPQLVNLYEVASTLARFFQSDLNPTSTRNVGQPLSWHKLSVNGQLLVSVLNTIPGYAYHALNVVLIICVGWILSLIHI